MNLNIRRIILGVVVAIVVAIAVWWLRSGDTGGDGDGSGGWSSAGVTAEEVAPIVGRWRRPDGGYILDIRGVDEAGDLVVGYFNPRPINVSQAQAVRGSRGLHVFVELRDQNYPGATYRLDYDAGKDVMIGVYHQPAINQSFEVYFVRAEQR
jgi:hypothetical protein